MYGLLQIMEKFINLQLLPILNFVITAELQLQSTPFVLLTQITVLFAEITE